MSKKDYQAIARVLYELRGTQTREIAGRIADVMQADNPQFDRQRFVGACETGGKVTPR